MSFDFGGGPTGSSDPGWSSTPPSQPAPAPGSAGGPRSGFGAALPPVAPVGEAVSAPIIWLVIGLATTLVAIAIHLVLAGFTGGLVGWIVGGPVAIGMLALFIRADTQRRGGSFYAESGVAEWGRRVLVGLALVAVALNAWAMADVMARGGR